MTDEEIARVSARLREITGAKTVREAVEIALVWKRSHDELPGVVRERALVAAEIRCLEERELRAALGAREPDEFVS